tara:strand:- start:454 stop:1092 length:639 start_codon:yes stop_codon:yes gene_type:complete
MVTIFKIFLILLSTLLVQNKAFSYGMNSGKVSVSVSVSKTDKSGDKSTEAKTEATASKSIDSNATSSKNKSISDTAETHSAKNLSNENSYSYDDNDNSSDGSYGKNKTGNKLNGKKTYEKFEIAKQERLFDAIKNFKNEKNISEVNLEKLDNLVNKRIKEIAKKIKFKFDEDDEKQFFEFTQNASINIDKIEKKAELVDYVQKTFEVMGLIN